MSAPGEHATSQRRALLGLLGLMAVLLAAPWLVDRFLLSLLILVLYAAYTGQAWNIMMGFAGQLSLGHSLYVGLGAYAAAALFIKAGIGPWAGLVLAVAVAALFGAVIGWLAFRFGIGGVYFALVTIAFAEFTRIGFDHWTWVGGSGGFFLPVAQQMANDPLRLRGEPIMFYHVLLAMTAGLFLLCWRLRHAKIGFYWLAIRENPEAAAALGVDTFRYKLLAVVLSAALTAPAGMFFAFYYNTLFPEQIFSIGRSIEIILAPIIGGVGTLFGPILGAFVLTGLAEGLREILAALGIEFPGVKQVFYGLCLLVVVAYLPNGIWPGLSRRLGLGR